MKMKRLVFGMAVAAAVLVPAGTASAEILISFPPSPIAPPPTEETYLVRKPAPVNVSILFSPNAGPPDVFVPNPGPR